MDGTFVEELKKAITDPQLFTEVEKGSRLIVPEGWSEIRPVAPPQPKTIQVYTLQAAVRYLKHNADELDLTGISLHVVHHGRVDVLAPLDEEFQARACYLSAVVDPAIFGAGFEFGRYHDAEAFVIALQTLFVQTDTRDQILQLVAGIREEDVRLTFDDGVAQSVKVAAGVTMVGEVKVPNPVVLRPWRTFREVEQPESLFVLRMQKGPEGGGKPRVALFEADGGSWKLAAIGRITAWLRDCMESEELAVGIIA